MPTLETIELAFNWPQFPESSFAEEFVFGFWHPLADVVVDYPLPPAGIEVSFVKGRNWSIVSTCSPFLPQRKGLVHPGRCNNGKPAVLDVVAFRGYVLDPPIHSWSSSEEILDYWSADKRMHNGVFASILVDKRGERLRLITDAFGISSLYCREHAGGVLFATNSRFLTSQKDGLDFLAARVLLQCGAVYGNRTLTEGVCRVPAGTVTHFSGNSCSDSTWFSFADLPQGTENLTSDSLQDVEDSLSAAVDRCLKLKTSEYVLPLSSGYDSRRILALLLSRNVSFQALTVRILQKQDRDLDAVFSSEMAAHLGFEHRVIDQPEPGKYAKLDAMRRLLVDSHSCDHTWFLSLFPYLPQKQSLIFDGLGGDVLGETGFEVQDYHNVQEIEKLHLISSNLIGNEFDNVLNAGAWPSKETVRSFLQAYLDHLPFGKNRADLAYILMRSRSSTGLCFQRLVPAGHVTVYPYLDLDVIASAFRVDPLAKLSESLQALCLQKFWPEIYKYHGTRNIPHSMPVGDKGSTDKRKLQCAKQLLSEVKHAGLGDLCSCLTKTACAKLLLGGGSDHLLLKSYWWAHPLLASLSRQLNNKRCW